MQHFDDASPTVYPAGRTGRAGRAAVGCAVGVLLALASAAPVEAQAGSVSAARDRNPAPNVFSTRLVAKPARLDLDGDGVRERVWTFNGQLPGPEIRVKAGDIVNVRFKNRLPVPSTIHWHGITVTNSADGTPVTQDEVPPGGTYRYRFVAPHAGIFWYHPHIRPSNQVFKGLYGSVIVTDSNERKLERLGVIPRLERTLVLSDVTVCKQPGANDEVTFPSDPTLSWAGEGPYPGSSQAPSPRDLCEQPMDGFGYQGGEALPAGSVPNIQPNRGCLTGDGPPCRVNMGQWVLANGRVPAARSGGPDAPGAMAAGAKPLWLGKGEAVRLRLINAAIFRYFRLRLTNAAGELQPIYRIGGEGGLLNRARLEGGVEQSFDFKYDRGEIVVGPSDRADVVVYADGEEGELLTLWTLDYSHTGRGYARLPTVPVMHFKIGEPRGSRSTVAHHTRLLSDPRVDRPFRGLRSFKPTGRLVDPQTLPGAPPGSDDHTIRFTNANGPSIDNVVGHFDAAEVDDFTKVPFIASSRFARVGDLLRLEVRNDTSAHHIFHLHGFSFQPLKLRLAGRTVYKFRQPEFVDSIDIPGGHSLIFKVLLEDRPLRPGSAELGGALGRWLFHCHLFTHPALGMISELVVLPAE